LLAAFVLYLLVEYPLRTLITVFILPKLSNDDVLRRHYLSVHGKKEPPISAKLASL
jgi:hypothetical protein